MVEMNDDKRIEFLERLIHLTEANKAEWLKGKDDYWFRTEMTRFTYAIESRDGDDVAPFNLHIYRTQEEPSGPVETWSWDFDEGDSPVNDRLRSLYQTVKRRVIGYTDLFEGIFRDVAEVEAEVDPS